MTHCTGLPVELWMVIFEFACTDGGATGRSLALVSKPCHVVSAPLRLQSVAIDSLQRLHAFQCHLQNDKLAQSPVRSLLLWSTDSEEVRGADTQWYEGYKAIIPVIAPTLEALAVINLPVLCMPFLVPSGVELPVLRHLVAQPGPYSFGAPDLPSLRHAHFYGVSKWQGLVLELAEASPNVESLYLSGVAFDSLLPETLAEISGLGPEPDMDPATIAGDGRQSALARLSTTIRRVTVEPLFYDCYAALPGMIQQHEEMMTGLGRLASDESNKSQRLTILPLQSEPEYDDDALRRVWLDATESGCGQWTF